MMHIKSFLLNIIVVVFVIQFFCSGLCYAQSYPYWFLNSAAVKCGKISIGCANISFYPDSAAARAIRTGYKNYARHRTMEINGGQAFWSTEIGMYWMGSNFAEKFDSSAIELAASMLTPLDTLVTENLIGVLLVSSDCELVDQYRRRLSLKGVANPSWIENLPQDNSYIYARGLAPKYYYETSSWREAEKWALLNLARVVNTKLQTVQKVGQEGQEILHEEMSVVLRNVEIVYRWRDLDEQFFYVLVRMPKF